jgi:hypothetical protein
VIARAAAGAWEFVVGDDWRVALGIALTLGATALVAAAGLPAWWLAPIATLVILHRSLKRAVGAAEFRQTGVGSKSAAEDRTKCRRR